MLFTTALKTFGLVMRIEGAALRLTPLGMVVTAISAFIVGGLYVYNNWAAIKPKLYAVWDGIKSWLGGRAYASPLA